MKKYVLGLSFLFLAASCASAAERPNILFAIADDWGFGHASAYGAKWVNTPAFDRVAREGILFTRAYTPNAKCAPSRAIILTGRYSWQLESAANHQNVFPAKFGSYVEVLAANGYTTGYTGKGWGPGVANDVTGKRRNITGKAWSAKKAKPPARAISNNDYSANFAAFLNAAPKGEPWCFWYGTTEPHRAYEKGVGLRMGKKLSDIDHVPTSGRIMPRRAATCSITRSRWSITTRTWAES
jgi:arylsulfatase A-like enzyme